MRSLHMPSRTLAVYDVLMAPWLPLREKERIPGWRGVLQMHKSGDWNIRAWRAWS